MAERLNVSGLIPGRRAGVIMHVTSLPGPYGIGEIGMYARAFIDRLVDMQLGVWQFLPTGPTAYGDSPYQPLSAFAGNEMLIGIGPLQRMGLVDALVAEALTELPPDRVDYGRLIPLKHALLTGVAGRFADKADADLRVAYEEFLHRHGTAWLDDYAAYRILKTMHGEKPWPEWEPAFVRREPAAMGRLVNEDANFPKGNIQPLCCRATRGARTFWGEHIPYCFRAPSARGDSISGWGAHFNPSEYKRTPQGFDRQILAGVHDQVTRCAVPAHDAESGARVARVQADPARSCQAAC